MLAGLDPEGRKEGKIVIEKCIEEWHRLVTEDGYLPPNPES